MRRELGAQPGELERRDEEEEAREPAERLGASRNARVPARYMPTPTQASQYAMRGGSPSSRSPSPAATRSSANAGSMWPTAKIARAIVGEPPESSSTLRSISAAESK